MYGGDEVSYGCEILTQELSMAVKEELEQVQENGIVPNTVLMAACVYTIEGRTCSKDSNILKKGTKTVQGHSPTAKPRYTGR